MLKNHKTLDLSRQRGQQKRDRLYDRKKWKYLKYITVPALIACILLCILAKINFTKNISKELSNKVLNKIKENKTNSQDHLDLRKTKHDATEEKKNLPRSAKTFANTENNTRLFLNLEQVTTELQINSEILIADAQASFANAIKCQEYKENCTLSCSDGTVSFVEENLEDFQLKCPGVLLNLMVEKCEFNFGTLQQSFFHGAFKLGSLTISQCNLKIIQAAAFKHTNVQNLQTLILSNNQLANLQFTSFEGLANLLYLEFVQAALSEPFKGEGFLKPLAKSLNKAILQPSTNGSDVIKPLDWWPALVLTSLTYLDLSNTNLQGALDKETFHHFEAVEYVILYNCNLLTVKAEIFDIISNSLKYLDLRYNQLQTLDSEFMQMFDTKSIEMDLSLNAWYCECEQDMLQYFMQHDNKLAEGIICSTPEKWQQMELLNVIGECGVSETTTKITSTTNSTTEMSTSSITGSKPITTTTEDAITIPTTTQYTSTTFSQQPPSTTKKTTSNPTTTATPFTSTIGPSNLMAIKCYMSNKKPKRLFYILTNLELNLLYLLTLQTALKST